MSRNTILIVWAIHDFRQTKHRFIKDLSRELFRIVITIIVSIFRSTKSLFIRETISLAKSIAYSSDWAIDVDVFRRDVKQFYENIVEYRQFQIFFNFVNFKSSIDQSSFDSFVINNSFFIDVTSNKQLNLDFVAFRNNRFRDVNDSSVTKTSTIRLSIDFVFTLNVSSLIDFDEVISRNIKITTNISIEKSFIINQLNQAYQLQKYQLSLTCLFFKINYNKWSIKHWIIMFNVILLNQNLQNHLTFQNRQNSKIKTMKTSLTILNEIRLI